MMRRICLLFPLLLLFPAASEGAQGLKNVIYQYDGDKRTWKEAQTFCREFHTDLLTINGAEEILDLALHGWIGLYRESSNAVWNWSRRGEAADFPNWMSGHPKEGEDCVFMSHRNTWQSDHCNASRDFICYDERLVLVKKRLVLVKKKRIWERALRYCRALEAVDSTKKATSYQNHRYDLATLLSPDDHDHAWRLAQFATTDEVWTGLRYLAGEWLWVGGEALQYDIESCPSQRSCGVLVKNGTTSFETRKCDERRNFLCYKRVE